MSVRELFIGECFSGMDFIMSVSFDGEARGMLEQNVFLTHEENCN